MMANKLTLVLIKICTPLPDGPNIRVINALAPNANIKAIIFAPKVWKTFFVSELFLPNEKKKV